LSDLTSNAYLCHYLNSFDFMGFVNGTTRLKLTQGAMREIPVPLPPLDEQHRIVAKIEQLFAESRTAREALDGVPALIKRFRQAVLAKAFRGELTERDPASRDEPASVLLEWTRKERRANSKKGVEPEPPDISGLPELPDQWCWASVEQCAFPELRSIQSGPFGSALHHSEFQDSGILAIGIDNVLEGRFSMGKQHRVSQEKFQQLKKFAAHPLDVLITVMATVGRCCVVPADLEPAIITKHVYRISTDGLLMNPYFLMYGFLSPEVNKQILSKAQGQTRPGINGQILKSIAVPVAPLTEQRRIIAKIEALFAQADAIETAVNIARQRAEKVDQAILARAFRGEL
jgi:type I restriction enzyme, S subunit